MKKLFLVFLLSPASLFANTNHEVTQTTETTNSEQTVFGNPTEAVSEEALRRYVGVYQLKEQFQISITLDEGKLYGLAPGDAEITEFTPVSGNKFIIQGPETEVEFLEEDGDVQYMLVNMQGGLKLKRIR